MAASTCTILALADFMFSNYLSIVLTGIQCSAVNVNHSSLQRGVCSQCILQSMDVQIRFLICIHCKNDDAKVKVVENRRNLHLLMGCSDLCDVCGRTFPVGHLHENPSLGDHRISLLLGQFL